jgi:hypothetical protein
MAAAAIELAEGYQRQGHLGLVRWGTIIIVAVLVPTTIYAAIDGDALETALLGLSALVNVAHLLLSPATRPKNVARSLEASRQTAAAVAV